MKSHYLCTLVFLHSSKIKSFSYIQHVTMFLTCFFMIPIVFLSIIVVLNFLIILLVQVVIFFMCFYLVLNLTTKVRIFTYDWASPTGNSSRGSRRTGSYVLFGCKGLLVIFESLERLIRVFERLLSSPSSSKTPTLAYGCSSGLRGLLGRGSRVTVWPSCRGFKRD